MQMTVYMRLLFKWIWLLIPAALIAGAVGYFTSSDPSVSYRAETLVSIGRYVESPNPDTRAIQVGQSLAATYEQVIRTEAVIENTLSILDLPLSVGQVRGMLNTGLIAGTSILNIQITSPDPELSIALSRGLTEQLIIASPTNLTRDESAAIRLAQREIDALSELLENTRAQLEVTEQRLVEAEGEEAILRLLSQHNIYTERINQASANLAQFTNTIDNIQQRTNELRIIDTPRVSRQVSGTSRTNSAIIAAFAGLVLAGGGIVLIEYLNSTIKSPDEAVGLLRRPVLGSVRKFGQSGDTPQQKLIMDNPQSSAAVEGYRTIRTNLLFGQGRERCGRFVVISPSSREGRTITIANLAAAISFDDLRVLLIDADMRNPSLHEVFDLSNDIGLTTLIQYEPEVFENPEENHLSDEVKACVQETAVPGLFVITAGPPTSEPTEIVSSKRMMRWVEAFNTVYGFDYILMDTPPALVVSDGPALAATVDARALLLIDVNRTSRGDAVKVQEHLDYLGVDTIGILINRNGNGI